MAWWQLVVPSQSAPFKAAEWNTELHNCTMSDFIIHSQLSKKRSPGSRTSSTNSSHQFERFNNPGSCFYFCFYLLSAGSCLSPLTPACFCLLLLAPTCSCLFLLVPGCICSFLLVPARSRSLLLVPVPLLEAHPATGRLKSMRVVARSIDFSTAASTTFVRRVAEAIDSITYLVNGETTRRRYQLTTLNRTAYQMGPIAASLNYSSHIFTISSQSLQSSKAE